MASSAVLSGVLLLSTHSLLASSAVLSGVLLLSTHSLLASSAVLSWVLLLSTHSLLTSSVVFSWVLLLSTHSLLASSVVLSWVFSQVCWLEFCFRSFSFFTFSVPVLYHLADHSKRGNKTRQTEEEVCRQVPEGTGEQGKWRKLVVKSSVVRG